MELWLQYLLLYLFLFSIIGLVISVWIYAKWHILGPKWKSRTKKINKWFIHLFDKDKPKVQKGAVIESKSVTEKLEQKEKESVLAQDLLYVQSEKIRQQKEVQKKQLELEAKVQKKADKKEDKAKQKSTAKEEKRRYKEEKKKYKNENKKKSK